MTAPLRLIREDRPRSICAYCQADLGPAPAGCTAHNHGICPTCQPIFFPTDEQLTDPALRRAARACLQVIEQQIRECDRELLHRRSLERSLRDQWGLS